MRSAVVLVAGLLAGCDNLLGLTAVGPGDGARDDSASHRDDVSPGFDGSLSAGLIMHVTFDGKKGDDMSCTADTTGAYTFLCHDDSLNDITTVPGVMGSAFSFTDDTYLTGEEPWSVTATSGLTVSFWFEDQPATITGCVLGKSGTDTSLVWTACMDTTVTGVFSGGSGLGWDVPFGNPVASGGEFHMASLTYDATNKQATTWFDGAQGSQTTVVAGLMDSPGILTIAAQLTSEAQATGFYTGVIDDLWIYDRTLGSDEINALYQLSGSGRD